MSTQPPSPNSQNDQTSKSDEEIAAEQALHSVHEDLKAHGIEPEALVCVAVSDSEMLVGECYDHKAYLSESGEHVSILQTAPFISLKNPKRLSRLQMQNRQTGQIGIQIQFGDFDFVEDGIIEVVPKVAFFFDWCDFGTQLRYCKTYLGFLEGKRQQRLKASGLILPGMPPATPGLIRG
jgi:hypothetical protein